MFDDKRQESIKCRRKLQNETT